MKTITQGHRYVLANFEDPSKGQTLQFIEKVAAPSDGDYTKVWTQSKPGGIATEVIPLVTILDGTTNEEVLAALIDRMGYLQGKFPCRENAIVITKLEEALMWLNKRTAGRVARGVEGTHTA